jgi:peptide/nickel transport system substrate-binding protein
MRLIAKHGFKVAASVIAGATALAACGGGSNSNTTQLAPSGAFGSAPPATGTPHAGTIKVAFDPGTSPTWIFPITPGANSSVYTSYQFQYESWRPLYWYVNGVKPVETPSLSLANPPTWSNGNKTVTVKVKPWKWSDGQPLTSKDAEFWISEATAAIKENPANWGNYTPKLGIPDQVASMSTPDSSTLVINLKAAVNPTWFVEDSLQLVQPMPAHAWAKASANGPILDFTDPANAKKIYDFLAGQSKSVNTYATNPLWQVVDGPYKITSFNNTTGAFTMSPNPGYSGPHAKVVSKLQGVPFTSETAEFNAIKSGDVDQGNVQQSQLPQIGSIKSTYNVFGYPAFGFNYVVYNFKDQTGHFADIIKQLYMRQAFAHLEDQAGYIKAFMHGAGGQAYGPVPSIPETPFTPANAKTNPYPFSVDKAVSILKAHGWTVHPGGTSVCTSAGTGSNQCGDGIPAGTKLAFNLIYDSQTALTTQMVTDLVSQAKKAGFNITLKSDNFNHMIATYYNVVNPKAINDWAMEDFGGFSISAYPTMNGIFNTTGSFNLGSYSDPKADALIKASTTSSDPNAVKKEAAYLTEQQPGLFQPGNDRIRVWKKTLSGPPASFESLTQFQLTPELWYFTTAQ